MPEEPSTSQTVEASTTSALDSVCAGRSVDLFHKLTGQQTTSVRPTGHYTTPSILTHEPFDLTPLLFALGVTLVIAVCGLVVFCLVRRYRRQVRRRDNGVPADALQQPGERLALDEDDDVLFVDEDDEFLDDL